MHTIFLIYIFFFPFFATKQRTEIYFFSTFFHISLRIKNIHIYSAHPIYPIFFFNFLSFHFRSQNKVSLTYYCNYAQRVFIVSTQNNKKMHTDKNLGRTTAQKLVIIVEKPKDLSTKLESHTSTIKLKSHTLQLNLKHTTLTFISVSLISSSHINLKAHHVNYSMP